MGKITNSTFISLDDVINHMDRWHFDFIDDESDAIALQQLHDNNALLMGRRTYEIYASTWPGRGGEYADGINAMTKYVASSTMKEPPWANTTVLDGDLVEAVTTLKKDPEQRISDARVRAGRQDPDEGGPAGRAVPVGPPHVRRRRHPRRHAPQRRPQRPAHRSKDH